MRALYSTKITSLWQWVLEVLKLKKYILSSKKYSSNVLISMSSSWIPQGVTHDVTDKGGTLGRIVQPIWRCTGCTILSYLTNTSFIIISLRCYTLFGFFSMVLDPNIWKHWENLWWQTQHIFTLCEGPRPAALSDIKLHTCNSKLYVPYNINNNNNKIVLCNFCVIFLKNTHSCRSIISKACAGNR